MASGHIEDEDDAGKFLENLCKKSGDINPIPREDIIHAKLAGGKTLFYPASEFDWAVIDCFVDRCSVFVFCDWQRTVAEFDQAMLQVSFQNQALNCLRCNLDDMAVVNPQLLLGEPIDPVSFALPEDRQGLQGRFDYERAHAQQPWGRWIPAISVVNGEERHINILYLCAEGVSAYCGLFKAHKIAPKVLCIKNCGVAFGGNFTAFYNWNEPLGRAVEAGLQAGQPVPEYVFSERREFNWPWNRLGEGLYHRPPN